VFEIFLELLFLDKVIRSINRGAFGEVFEVEGLEDKERYAAKRFFPPSGLLKLVEFIV
jgi:hypothetical protein